MVHKYNLFRCYTRLAFTLWSLGGNIGVGILTPHSIIISYVWASVGSLHTFPWWFLWIFGDICNRLFLFGSDNFIISGLFSSSLIFLILPCVFFSKALLLVLAFNIWVLWTSLSILWSTKIFQTYLLVLSPCSKLIELDSWLFSPFRPNSFS